MKKLLKEISEGSISKIIVELISIGTFYLISKMDELKIASLGMESIAFMIMGLLFGFLIILYAKTYTMLNKVLERVNYFHWMSNYRFEEINKFWEGKSENMELSMFDERELKHMIEKISSYYHDKPRKEIIDELRKHYGKFITDETYQKYVHPKPE